MGLLRSSSLLLILLSVPAGAQRLAYENVLESEHRVGPRLSYEPLLTPASAQPPQSDEEGPVRAFYGDRLEWRPGRGAEAYNWDFSAEIGGASHRLWLAATGDWVTEGGLEYLETQALYSRPIGDSGLALQAGLRQDFVPRPRRTYAVLGLQGNLTDPLAVGAFGFLSHRGEFTGRAFAVYDLGMTGRLILQPAVEAEIAGADVPALGIGAGLVYVQAGLRLRYRLAEAFAPYVGVHWQRLLGGTARMAREEEEEVDSANLVLGVRSYF